MQHLTPAQIDSLGQVDDEHPGLGLLKESGKGGLLGSGSSRRTTFTSIDKATEMSDTVIRAKTSKLRRSSIFKQRNLRCHRT
jgi:hypothetical protein